MECVCRCPQWLKLVLFCAVNMLNYMDRGILAGGFELINTFILETLPAATPGNVDAYRGILTASFIVSYSLSSVVFGHLVHRFPPFKLMAIGLFVWCCAVVICAFSPNYVVLLVGRALSGVGEASFQCVVPPYIDDKSTQETRARNLALFFAMIPFGTAVGYGWSGIIGSSLGWRWSFGLEAPLMLPLAFIVFFLEYDVHHHKHGSKHAHAEGAAAGESGDGEGGDGDGDGDGDEEEDDEAKLTLWDEFGSIFSSPIYVCAAFGYAAYTFAVAGFGAFGPQFLHDLRLVTSLSQSSVVFGGLIAVTGFVGTAVGGVFLDRMQKADDTAQRERLGITGDGKVLVSALAADYDADAMSPKAGRRLESLEIDVSSPRAGRLTSSAAVIDDEAGSRFSSEAAAGPGAVGAAAGSGGDTGGKGAQNDVEDEATKLRTLDVKLCASLRQITGLTLAGLLVCIGSVLVVPLGLVPFAVLLGLGTLLLFAATAGTNIAIMASVPATTRPLAIGVGTVITHAFGDVPSPILIGLISDALAPDYDDNRPRSKAGLQMTLLIVVLWIVWAVLLWGAAWYFSTRRRKVNEEMRVYEELGGGDESQWALCGLVDPVDDEDRGGFAGAMAKPLLQPPSEHVRA